MYLLILRHHAVLSISKRIGAFNVRKIALLQRHTIPLQRFELVSIYGKGQKNEAILNEVIRRLQAKEIDIPFLRLKIQVLERAIEALAPEEKRYVEQKCVQKLATPLVLEKMCMPARSFYRLRRRTLKQIYDMVGGKDSILWMKDSLVPDEES